MLVRCDVESPEEALGVVAMERPSVAQLEMADLELVVNALELIVPARAPALEDLDLDVGRSPREWRTALEVDDERAVVLLAQLDLVGVIRRQLRVGWPRITAQRLRQMGRVAIEPLIGSAGGRLVCSPVAGPPT